MLEEKQQLLITGIREKDFLPMEICRATRKLYEKSPKTKNKEEWPPFFDAIYESVSKKTDAFFTGGNAYGWHFLAKYLLEHDESKKRYIELIIQQFEKWKDSALLSFRSMQIIYSMIDQDFLPEARHALGKIFCFDRMEKSTHGKAGWIDFAIQRKVYIHYWSLLLQKEGDVKNGWIFYAAAHVYHPYFGFKTEEEQIAKLEEDLNAYALKPAADKISAVIKARKQLLQLASNSYFEFPYAEPQLDVRTGKTMGLPPIKNKGLFKPIKALFPEQKKTVRIFADAEQELFAAIAKLSEL